MPEPTIFLNRRFPVCSIVRPTETEGAAMGAVRALTADGLFIGQSQAFFNLLRDLAEEADEAGSEVRSRRRQMNFAVRVIGIKCEEIQPRPLRDAKWHGEGEVF
jgi:hypothetical protein